MGEEAPHASGDHKHGQMDVREHKSTFDGFMVVTVWASALVVMALGALTAAFAMGAGWFAGVAVWTALGVAIGFGMKMSARWWGMLIGSTGLFLVGGGIAALVAGLAA